MTEQGASGSTYFPSSQLPSPSKPEATINYINEQMKGSTQTKSEDVESNGQDNGTNKTKSRHNSHEGHDKQDYTNTGARPKTKADNSEIQSRRELPGSDVSQKINVLAVYCDTDGIKHEKSMHQACNVDEHMKWRFIMHSNSHLECLNEMIHEQLQIDGSLHNGFLKVNGNSTDETVTEKFHKIVDFALGLEGITVKSIPLNMSDADSVHNQIKDLPGLKTTCYSEVINNDVYIVFTTRNKHKVHEYLKGILPIMPEKKICKEIELNPVWQCLLKMFNLLELLEKTIGALEVKVDLKTDSQVMKCSFEGSQSSVENAIEEFKKLEKRVVKEKCNFSVTHVQGIAELNLTDYLNDALRRMNLRCCISQKRNDLHVYGLCKTSVDQGCKLVESTIIEKPLLVKEIDPDVLKQHMHEVKTRNHGCIVFMPESKHKIFVLGVRNYVEHFVHRMKQSSPRRNSGMQKYIIKIRIPNEEVCKFMNTSALIKHIMNKNKVELTFEKVEDSWVLAVEGEESMLDIARNQLEKLMDKCKTKTLSISDMKIVQYVLGSDGWNSILDSVQQNDVLLTMTIQHTESCEDISWYPDRTVYHRRSWANIRYGRCIELVNKFETDSSYCIKFTSTKVMKKKKTTSAAYLCVPPWTDENTARRELHENLTKTLEEASKKGNKDIAVLVQDVFDWPTEYFAMVVAKAAVQWLFKYDNQAILHIVVQVSNDDICYNSGGYYVNKYYKQHMKGTENKLTVTVIPEELSKCRSDVLVNTTSKDLDLSYGRVSKSLLRAAGPEIQAECDKKYPYGIETNEIAVTGGYKLNCEKVFHVTLDKYMQLGVKEKDCIQNIRYLVKKCLERTSKFGLESIAFPALGTGVLHYPVDLVCTAMFESVEEYRMNNPKTSLRLVQFIIYPKNVSVLEVFQANEANMEGRSHVLNQESMHPHSSLVVCGLSDNVNGAIESLEKIKTDALCNPKEVIEVMIKEVNRMIFTIWNKYYAVKIKEEDINVKFDDKKSCLLLTGQRCNIEKYLEVIVMHINEIKGNTGKQIKVPQMEWKYIDIAIKATTSKFSEDYCMFAYDMYLHLMYLCEQAEHVSEFEKDLIFEIENVKDLAAKETPVSLGSTTRVGDNSTVRDIDPSKESVLPNEISKKSNKHVENKPDEREPVNTIVDMTASCYKDEQPEHSSVARDTLFQDSKDTSFIVNIEHIESQHVRIFSLGRSVVYVYQGDLLKVKTDCIVNPANQSLGHYGGLAGILAKYAGKQMIDESEEIVKQKGIRDNKAYHLPVTTVVKTSAGNLPYKSIIHAVGPCWYDYKVEQKPQCATDLCQTVVNCLMEAERSHYTSIALPMISSGLFGVPQSVCSAQYIMAIETFKSKTQNSLKEIHFLDINGAMVDLVQRYFASHFHELKPGDTIIVDKHSPTSHQKVSSHKQDETARNMLQSHVPEPCASHGKDFHQETHKAGCTKMVRSTSRETDNLPCMEGTGREDILNEKEPVRRDRAVADMTASDTKNAQHDSTASFRDINKKNTARSKPSVIKDGGTTTDDVYTLKEASHVSEPDISDSKCLNDYVGSSTGRESLKLTARDRPKDMNVDEITDEVGDLEFTFNISRTMSLLLCNRYDQENENLDIEGIVCYVKSNGKCADKLSKEFYDSCGTEYRKKLFGQFQPVRNPYDVVVTKCFGLGYNYIFHAVISHREEIDWYKLYQNILEKTKAYKVHSLCLSLICFGKHFIIFYVFFEKYVRRKVE
ncbi:E3 ubiquitin-protein ligase dtx3l [Mactra antiquata]